MLGGRFKQCLPETAGQVFEPWHMSARPPTERPLSPLHLRKMDMGLRGRAGEMGGEQLRHSSDRFSVEQDRQTAQGLRLSVCVHICVYVCVCV